MNDSIIYKYFPEFDVRQRRQIDMLASLYEDWNSKINVISRKDMENLYLHHVLHSLAIVKYIKSRGLSPSCIIDAGTGGGFPGIPMAIAMPECRFTLCDSIAKKIKVVTEVSSALGLENVVPVCSRTEALSGQTYDFVVSRAVTELRKFLPLVRNLYSEGILYLKGGDVAKEISDCRPCPQNVEIVKISDFFEEDYFESKKIICIFKQKHYLCTPFIDK